MLRYHKWSLRNSFCVRCHLVVKTRIFKKGTVIMSDRIRNFETKKSDYKIITTKRHKPQGWVWTNRNVNCSIVNDTRAVLLFIHTVIFGMIYYFVANRCFFDRLSLRTFHLKMKCNTLKSFKRINLKRNSFLF